MKHKLTQSPFHDVQMKKVKNSFLKDYERSIDLQCRDIRKITAFDGAIFHQYYYFIKLAVFKASISCVFLKSQVILIKYANNTFKSRYISKFAHLHRNSGVKDRYNAI